ncbi:class I SAM-dependent methyltransferase [Cytobacillus sp. FSL R7-0680]|uniref:class I SAM-dependent methyltransferase n=1 Tax=Cytobacillus sp. FSL R7-0680 TaxID=2921689 RepID=UPI0030FBEA80
MKENIYDQASFFEKYSQMTRSVKGLEGAGEWQTLKGMLPTFQDKTVLDLGCGFGWHCRFAAEHGAKSVVGVDISEKMISKAKTMSQDFENVTYIRSTIEDMQIKERHYDVIVSSLALHYVPDFEEVANNVHKGLVKGGQFIFSVEHPIFTAQGSQDWFYDAQQEVSHFPVDHYFFEGERQTTFLEEKVTKYHKTLTTYLDGLLKQGFQITRVVEPKPPEHMMHTEEMKNEMRRPMMIIISATKYE